MYFERRVIYNGKIKQEKSFGNFSQKKGIKMETKQLITFLTFLLTSSAQDSWETYEDSDDYYESFEKIDIQDAKQYFCTEVKEEFKECVINFFKVQIYDSCYEKIGLKSRNFKDAVDEVCLFDDPTIPAVK
ncbi:hypothetical protein NPIL_341621, partial [Nephila pilipes]